MELKENDIKIADTETAAIAFICKANNVECIILKGISDFPIKDDILTKGKTHQAQYNTFVKNIPIIMNKIFDNFLEFAMHDTVPYKERVSETTKIVR